MTDPEMQFPDKPVIGGVASDDPLWVAQCSLAQVRKLIHDPMQWMAELSKKAEKEITLRSPFAMRIRLLPAIPAEKGKPFLVQGINGTSVITIRPTKKVRPLEFSLQEHWSLWVSREAEPWEGWDSHWTDHPAHWSEKESPLFVATHEGVAFAHTEITAKGDNEAQRADKITSFLIQAATSGGALFDQILAREPTQPNPDLLGGLAPFSRRGNDSIFEKINRMHSNPISISYVGTGQPVCDSACDNLVGYINSAGKIEIDEITVKCY